MDNFVLGVLAVVWIFGALGVWPILRAIDATRKSSLQLLKWTFLLQVTLQFLWAIWLAFLWVRNVSNIEHGLIPLYIIGSIGWLISLLAFIYWLLERRRTEGVNLR